MINIDSSIVKEFDKLHFKANEIVMIMNKLDSNDKKNRFYIFLMENRNTLLSFSEILNEINNYKN